MAPTPHDRDALADQIERLLAVGGPLPIVAAGDPVLRRATVPFDGQLGPELLARFVEALRETMRAAPGVGLAAPQVGVGLRIAVVEDPAPVPEEVRVVRGRVPLPFRVLVNPSYEAVGTDRAAFFEGCLSVPGWQAVVARHAAVRLTAQDEYGRAVDEVFTAGRPDRPARDGPSGRHALSRPGGTALAVLQCGDDGAVGPADPGGGGRGAGLRPLTAARANWAPLAATSRP